MAIKFGIRNNKSQDVKDVFILNVDVADLKEFEESEVIDDCTKYGYTVYLQNTVGGKARSSDAIKKHLDKSGIEYTFEADVPVKKAEEKLSDDDKAMLKAYRALSPKDKLEYLKKVGLG